MKLEIDRTLVCTTAHLTEEDNQALFYETTGLVVYEMGEYGWMVLARPVNPDASPDSVDRQHSDNLERLLQFARDRDCEWVRFDRDASEIEGLQTFNW